MLHISPPSDWVLESISGEFISSGYGSEIKTSSLPNGIYLLKINNEVFRIIKEE